MKQPQHPAGAAFIEARGLISFYERQLQGPEKQAYNEFRREQKKDRDTQKQKSDEAAKALEDSRKKRPNVVKNYDPPIKIQNPQHQLYAKRAAIEKTKLVELVLTQKQERVRFLEKSNKQRAQAQKDRPQPTRDKDNRQASKTATFRENAVSITRLKTSSAFALAAAATPSKDTALTKAFEKAKDREIENKNTNDKNNDHDNSRKI